MTRRLTAVQALLAAGCRVRRRPGSVSPLRWQQLPSRCCSRPRGRQVASPFCASYLCVGAELSIVRRRGGRRHCQACSRRGGADRMGPLAGLGGFGCRRQVDAAVARRLSTFWYLIVCLLVHSSMGVNGELGREVWPVVHVHAGRHKPPPLLYIHGVALQPSYVFVRLWCVACTGDGGRGGRKFRAARRLGCTVIFSSRLRSCF